MSQLIVGSGGGGGKGGSGGSARVAVESPDNLHSRQYARVIDMVSEGEIEGVVGGLQGVYLDDTPIQNADGSMNFTGVTIDTRNGTQNQSYLVGFSQVENEVAIGSEVKLASPVTRQISNVNLDAVRVTLEIPALSLQNTTNGDLGGTSVQIAIDVQDNGGGFVAQPLGYDTVGLAMSGMSGSSPYKANAVNMSFEWTGNPALETPQYASATVQARLAGSSDPWVTVGTVGFSGQGYDYVDVYL